jgi:hypothetical protein
MNIPQVITNVQPIPDLGLWARTSQIQWPFAISLSLILHTLQVEQSRQSGGLY